MRRLTPLLLAGVLLLGPAAGQASAVTIADLINLKANGLSDTVLIALIESDGSVFRLTAEDLIDLRKRGLSDAVLVAMMLTAKKAGPEPTFNAPGPSLLAESTAEVARQAQSVQTPQTTVNVYQTVTQKVEQANRETEAVYVPVPYYVPTVVAPIRRVEPVYWGYGGKRRADSWEDPRDRLDSKLDTKPDTKADTKADTRPGSLAGVKASASETAAATATKPTPKGGS